MSLLFLLEDKVIRVLMRNNIRLLKLTISFRLFLLESLVGLLLLDKRLTLLLIQGKKSS